MTQPLNTDAVPRCRHFPRAIVGGMPVDLCSEQSLTDTLVRTALEHRASSEGPAGLVFDVNGHGLALASMDPAYRRDVIAADIIHADGQPLVFASRLFCSQAIPERTATTDLIHAVGRAAQDSVLKLYFLGAKAEVIELAAARFRALYPRAQLVGYRDGYFAPDQLSAVAEAINASGADVVFVGIGKPREQAVCVALAPLLKARWLITAGGCFDFLAGNAPRAPGWMQAVGMEWLFRLSADPKRLLWRYVWTNLVASALLLLRTRRAVLPPAPADTKGLHT